MKWMAGASANGMVVKPLFSIRQCRRRWYGYGYKYADLDELFLFFFFFLVGCTYMYVRSYIRTTNDIYVKDNMYVLWKSALFQLLHCYSNNTQCLKLNFSTQLERYMYVIICFLLRRWPCNVVLRASVHVRARRHGVHRRVNNLFTKLTRVLLRRETRL